MKRLKNILLSLEGNTNTYNEMYNGKIHIIDEWYQADDFDPTYFNDDIGFNITVTNKLSLDKPTITISIPSKKLGINNYTDATADFCLREFKKYIDNLNEILFNKSRPDNENGKYYLFSPTGEILKRNCTFFNICPQRDYEYLNGTSVKIINDGVKRNPIMCLCIKLQVQLPKRKIRKTIQMLCKDLPDAVDKFIYEFDIYRLEEAIKLSEKQNAIRKWLKNSNYCAFIANGSILPREKNTKDPMKNAIPFLSPANDEIEIIGVKGMGIKKGVTVISGGGYSGKTTLLEAISSGVYNHIIGDGRELCITDDSAVNIAAEDGRSIKNVNISPFIRWLPSGDTTKFSTDNASGSTSQAANIMEAIDSGSKLLLIDEDKSATNFMIRDKLMKELIKKEPITPFTDRVNELYETEKVSTILVIGGSGEYLSVADKIYLMDDFIIHDVTKESKKICKKFNNHEKTLQPKTYWKQNRILYSERFTSYPDGSGSEKLIVSDMGFIIIGDERIDIRGLKNIVSNNQLDALGFMLRYLEISKNDNKINLINIIDTLYNKIEKEGIDIIYSAFFTTCNRFLELPRKQELIAVINRMRYVKYQ